MLPDTDLPETTADVGKTISAEILICEPEMGISAEIVAPYYAEAASKCLGQLPGERWRSAIKQKKPLF